MGPQLEVRQQRGWRALDAPVPVVEDSMVEVRGFAGCRRVEFGPIVFENPTDLLRIHLGDHDELRCHLGLLPIYVDGRLGGELDIRPGKLTADGWDILRAELNKVWTGLIFDDNAATSLAATGVDPVRIWRRIAPVIADLEQTPVSTLGATERWVRLERVRVPSELTRSVVLAGSRGRPGRGRSLGRVVSEPERALVRDFLRRLSAAALQHPGGHSTVVAINRFLTGGLFAPPSRLAPSISHLARHEPRLRQVVAARQELLNADVALTEGPGELRLGVKALDRLYEYWVFLTVIEQVRQLAGEPLPPGTAVLHRRLNGRKVRLELAAGTEVRFNGGITVAFSPTITSSGRGSWKGLELAGYHSDTQLRSPSLITPDIVVARESEDGQIRLFVIDAKYRARHKVDPALNEVYLKYSRIRQAGRPAVAAVIAAHPHHDLDIRWPGQWSLPYVPGADLPPRFLPASWVHMPESAPAPAPPPEPEGTEDAPDTTESPTALVLDRVFTRKDGHPQRSVREVQERSGITSPEAQSVAECAAWCRLQSNITWRMIVERTLRRVANGELEAAAESPTIALGVLGQMFRALQAEVPWIDVRAKPLLEVVATVLDEMRPPPGITIETRRETPHLVRSWNVRSAETERVPQTPRSTAATGRITEPELPDLVICDQQWMAKARRGVIIDLALMRTQLSGDQCPTLLLASAAGRSGPFQHAAVGRGWLAFDHLDRGDMIERCRSILRHTTPAYVVVVSGESDLIDLVGEYAPRIHVETSLSRFAMT